MSDVYPTSPDIGTIANGRIWDGSRWNCPALLIDAPADGNSYGRMNNTWQRVLPFNGGELQALLIDYDLNVLGTTNTVGLNVTGLFSSTGIADFGGQANFTNLAVEGSASVANTLYVNSLWVADVTASTGFLVDNGYLIATGGVLSSPVGASNSFGFWQGPGTNVMAFGFGTPSGTPTTDLMNLDINGNLTVNNNIVAGGTITPGCDARSKIDIVSYDHGINLISLLAPKTYMRRVTPRVREVGLIAQEVDRCFPEAVHGTDGFLGVDPMALIALLINGIKELAERVETLEVRYGSLSQIDR